MTTETTQDLTQYELNETAVLDVENARGDDAMMFNGKPVRITLYGPASKQYRNAEHRKNNAATTRMQSVLRGKIVKNQAETNDAEQIEKLVSCTANVENYPLGALDLYSDPHYVYVRDQVEAFINDKANFSKPSATN